MGTCEQCNRRTSNIWGKDIGGAKLYICNSCRTKKINQDQILRKRRLGVLSVSEAQQLLRKNRLGVLK